MKKVAALIITAIMVWAAAPSQAQAPTSWGDTQMVRNTVKTAYYKQNPYTQRLLCRKWYSNPAGPVFIKLARIADRMYGVSTREAAKGVVLAFQELC